MADDADLSEKETEFLLNVARQAAAIKAAKRLPPKGSCYNCEEPLSSVPRKNAPPSLLSSAGRSMPATMLIRL